MLDFLPSEYAVFHDLALPGSTARVDHLVIGPAGVYAVDVQDCSAAVLLGQGDDADRIWSGGRPVDLESASAGAAEVGKLLGVKVLPIACLVAPMLPEPVFEVDGVRVCHPNRVIAEVTRAFARRVDVTKVSRRVTESFGVEQQDRAQAALAGLPVRAPQRWSRRPWFRLLVIAVLLAAGLLCFRALAATSDPTGAPPPIERVIGSAG